MNVGPVRSSYKVLFLTVRPGVFMLNMLAKLHS
jgi:hypothetical protein